MGDNEVINAAHEWWDRERRPKPPKPKLSWACVQAVTVVSMEKQHEKHLLTSSSNIFKEPTRLGGDGPSQVNQSAIAATQS